MEEYLHHFKGIAKGRGLPPLNPMECGKNRREKVGKRKLPQGKKSPG
jgi:hypothetical protein